jgi:predicted HTH transcriptional regulator
MPLISKELIEQLLWEEESPILDFKSRQYPFANASDDEKSELLKDILAFSNAHRRDDAFILIGVKSLPGGRSQVVGVSEQLDDAHVQQFINSKTQRPLTFTYKAIDIDGLPIAVLHIPKQKRPFYATSQFGKVNKGAVYVRRGSSTAIALPDEIAAWEQIQLRRTRLNHSLHLLPQTVRADSRSAPT